MGNDNFRKTIVVKWIERLEHLGITPAQNDFAPLSEIDLRKIESYFGAKLPEDYRLFLLHYGASYLEESVVFPTPKGGIYLGDFLGNNILQLTIDDYEDKLPKLLVPINEDGGDNLICISLRAVDFGGIYFQYHCIGIGDNPDSDTARWETCFRFCDIFANFICGLEID